jgi:hypothetical protein
MKRDLATSPRGDVFTMNMTREPSCRRMAPRTPVSFRHARALVENGTAHACQLHPTNHGHHGGWSLDTDDGRGALVDPQQVVAAIDAVAQEARGGGDAESRGEDGGESGADSDDEARVREHIVR